MLQLVDRSNFVSNKKDSKERENSQPAFSRAFNNNSNNGNNTNVPPRFQNLNRQNSGGFPNSSSSSGPARSNSSQQSTNSGNTCRWIFSSDKSCHLMMNSWLIVVFFFFFSGKSGSPNFVTRHNRLDSESMSEKERDWSQEDIRKDRDNDK